MKREAEIHHDRFAPRIDDNVSWFQIPMNDPVVVGVLQCQREFTNQQQRLPFGVALVVTKNFCERLSFNVGHRNKVLALDLAHVKHRADIWVSQRSGTPRFEIEPLQ